jgi:hypothetical protein
VRHGLVILLGVVAFAAIVGCGPRPAVVSGVVTLDGKPLDNGTIQFFPVDGAGQTAGGVVGKDGRYRVEAWPNTMKVVIHSTRVLRQRPMYEGVPDSPLADVAEEVLPSRYSDMHATELRVTIVPGDNAVDFPLTHARE